MQLNMSLPEWAGKLISEKTLYALPFDVSTEGKAADGYCVLTQTRLLVLSGGRVQREWPWSSIAELSTEQLVGSGLLKAKLEAGGEALVCVFTHRWLPHYA